MRSGAFCGEPVANGYCRPSRRRKGQKNDAKNRTWEEMARVHATQENADELMKEFEAQKKTLHRSEKPLPFCLELVP